MNKHLMSNSEKKLRDDLTIFNQLNNDQFIGLSKVLLIPSWSALRIVLLVEQIDTLFSAAPYGDRRSSSSLSKEI